MNEHELIGQLVKWLLEKYSVHLPPLKKTDFGFEIDAYYLGYHIQIYEPTLLEALQKWEQKLDSIYSTFDKMHKS